MARDAMDLMDYFGWVSGVHLVGISMGGMIALEMATAEPHRLKSLTLTSTCAKKNIPTVTRAKMGKKGHWIFPAHVYLPHTSYK